MNQDSNSGDGDAMQQWVRRWIDPDPSLHNIWATLSEDQRRCTYLGGAEMNDEQAITEFVGYVLESMNDKAVEIGESIDRAGFNATQNSGSFNVEAVIGDTGVYLRPTTKATPTEQWLLLSQRGTNTARPIRQ